MNYNNFNEVTKQPVLLASLAGLINPVTIVPALAIGATGILTIAIVKRAFSLKAENQELLENNEILEEELESLTYEAEYEEDQGSEPYNEPLDLTVDSGSQAVESTVANMSEEELKKEMIRQTMSELGKRSAIARAKKKSN